MLSLVILVGAIVVALATGGSWAGLAEIPLHGTRLVVVAVTAQLLGSGLTRLTDHHAFYVAGLTISALAALAFCLRNLSVAGVPLITAGLALNAFVVLLNGAMPVSVHAATRADVGIDSIATRTDPRHTIAGRGTTLRILGDVIPAPFPLEPEVVSPGDILVAAGIGELVLLGMRRRRASASRPANEPDSTTSEPPAVALSQST